VPAIAAEEGAQDCYDAIVSARASNQVPSVYPDGGDEIVISWPWFVDLQINRVIEGRVKVRKLTVLAVLHGAIPSGSRRWWLRKNTAGGFNMLRFDEDSPLDQCSMVMPPARPYLQPAEGRSLADLRRDGEKAYRD
jgi:hypothetical protein